MSRSLLVATLLAFVQSLQAFRGIPFSSSASTSISTSIAMSSIAAWEDIKSSVLSTEQGAFMETQAELRAKGAGLPHTDAKFRLFGTASEPRVIYFRDTAAW